MSRSAGAVLLLAAATAGLLVAPAPAAAQSTGQPQKCTSDTFQLLDRQPYPLARLGARRLWPRATGRGVVVAVIDSGIERDNPHLKGATLPGASLLPGDPDPQGWTDVTSHGTAVAGAIAGRQVPGSGLVGLAREAKILPIRVYEAEDETAQVAGWDPDADRIASGIRLAADRGARIINVSMSQTNPDPDLDAAVAHATARGALVVASAGNRATASEQKDGPRFPAASPGALSVGAADEVDLPAADSVRGPHVDVIGPAPDVVAWLDQGDCAEVQPGSTSFATAYVSAAAALIAEVYPTATPAEIAYRLMASADRPRRANRDNDRGWGLVQPLDALTMTLDPSRPGPALPGTAPVARPEPPVQRIDVQAVGDPRAEVRERTMWWLLGGGIAVGLALLAGAARARRPRPRPAQVLA